MTVHLVVVLLAVLAVTFAARYPNRSNASPSMVTPSFALSGVTGMSETRVVAVFRPGASNQTRDSVSELTATNDVASVRAAGGVSPTSSFTAGVAAASASSGEQGAGIKPLADIVDPRQPFILHVVRPNDTLSGIAQANGISLRTLLDNNPSASEDVNLLPLGAQLVVPRLDGILYKVGHGDTVASIVKQFDNITADAVISYRPNAVSDPSSLEQGKTLLLIGATVKPPPPPPPPPPARPGGGGGGGSGTPLPGGSGRFSFPLAGWRSVSDEFGTSRGGGSYHTGIDLDLYGMQAVNIFSACDGVVSRTEYLTYSYGYHVVIDCGDGWSTLYAHMSQINVAPGQSVSAGSIIGLTGLTGYTTGHHLHFEIRIDGQYLNPRAYLGF